MPPEKLSRPDSPLSCSHRFYFLVLTIRSRSRKTHVATMRFPLFARKLSTSAVWEAGRKAREAARALAALPNEDRNAALERVASALESGKVHELICF